MDSREETYSFIKAGKRVLYDPNDIKKFMNENKVIPCTWGKRPMEKD